MFRHSLMATAVLAVLSQGILAANPELPVNTAPKVVKIEGLPARNSVPASTTVVPTTSVLPTPVKATESQSPGVVRAGPPTASIAPNPAAKSHVAAAPIKMKGDLPGMAGPSFSAKPVILRSPMGVNELVSISATQPSMIRTPFKDPEIIDNQADADITAIGSNVYVAPKGGQPFGIFITDKQNPSAPVVSLTLVPRDVPGQVIIVQPEGMATGMKPGEEADRPQPESYEAELVQILRDVVRNRTPQGFTKAPIKTPDARLGSIMATGVARWSGSEMDVYSYRLVNTGPRDITLTEQTFYSKGVKAVALFPAIRIDPGQSTNVYVLRGKSTEEDGE